MICYKIAIHCVCKLWTGTTILWFFPQFLDMSLPPGGQIQKVTWLKCCTLIDFMIFTSLQFIMHVNYEQDLKKKLISGHQRRRYHENGIYICSWWSFFWRKKLSFGLRRSVWGSLLKTSPILPKQTMLEFICLSCLIWLGLLCHEDFFLQNWARCGLILSKHPILVKLPECRHIISALSQQLSLMPEL